MSLKAGIAPCSIAPPQGVGSPFYFQGVSGILSTVNMMVQKWLNAFLKQTNKQTKQWKISVGEDLEKWVPSDIVVRM